MFNVLKSIAAQKSCVATIKEKVKKILTGFLLLFGLFVFAHETNSDYKKGLNALESKEYTEAIGFFDREIESWEDKEISSSFKAKVYNARGNANYKLGKHFEAIENYNMSIKVDSTYAKAYYNQGLVRTELSTTEDALNIAIEYFDKAIEIACKNNDSIILKDTYVKPRKCLF